MKKIASIALSIIILTSIFSIIQVSAADIPKTASGTTGDLKWNFDSETHTLSFDGKGKSADYHSTADVPWNSYASSVFKVEIGKDVESLHTFTLYVCKNINKYIIDEDNNYYSSKAGLLYSKDGAVLYRATSNRIFRALVKDGVKEIKEYALANSPWLDYVVLPDSVEKIGYAAFFGSSVTSVQFSLGANEIPSSCFKGCKELKEVTNLDNINKIDSNAFYDCENLEGLDIPKKVTKLGASSFEHAKLNKEVTIPEGITEIPENCFKNTFTDISNDFRFKLYMPNKVTIIKSSAFENSRVSRIITYSEKETSDENYSTIPKSVKKICDRAFYDASIGKLILQDGLEEIESEAFASSGLYTVEVPDTITKIGSNIIYDTEYAEENAPIETGVIYFGNYAVATVKNFADDIVIRDGTIGLSDSALTDNYKSVKITLPASLKYIPDSTLPFFGELKTVIVDEENPYFCVKDGILYSKDYTRLVMCPTKNEIKEVIIPDTVTEIAKAAFCYCGNIEKIVFPESLEKMGNTLCTGCSSLKSVTIPKNIEKVPFQSFQGCESLEEVKLHEGMTAIESVAFQGCKNLKKIELPSTLTKIDGSAFKGCENLTEISLPEGLTQLSASAFSNCKKLETVTLQSNIDNIPSYCFQKCTSLKTITIPEGIKYINYCAFSNCAALETVYVLDKLCGVDSNKAFLDCNKIKDIYLAVSDKDIDNQNEAVKKVYKGWNTLKAKMTNTAFHFNYDPLNPNPVEGTTATEATEPASAIPSVTVEPTETTTTVPETEPNTFEPTNPAHGTTTEAITTPSETTIVRIPEKTVCPISKISNPVKVSAKNKTVKAKKLIKKAQKIKPLTVKNAKGKVTVKLVKKGSNSKLFKLAKISKKGIITLKKWKKAKKGKYNLIVKITAKGNSKFKPKTINKLVKIKIK
ncbi:MAG: leucine-rich repeat protein [Ruminococcus sp.]|nr:leucine-rich repeat protein [Ruminococcus sp.]